MCNDDNEAANYYAVGRPAGCYRDHMEEKKNRYWVSSVVGFVLIVVCAMIGKTFGNPYPCSVSGIGCSSIWELISDTWASCVAYFGIMIGVAMVILGIMKYLTVGKKNEA